MNELKKRPKSFFKPIDIIQLVIPFIVFFLLLNTLPHVFSMLGGYFSLILFPIIGVVRKRIWLGAGLTFEGEKAVRISIALVVIIGAGIVYETAKILRAK